MSDNEEAKVDTTPPKSEDEEAEKKSEETEAKVEEEKAEEETVAEEKADDSNGADKEATADGAETKKKKDKRDRQDTAEAATNKPQPTPKKKKDKKKDESDAAADETPAADDDAAADDDKKKKKKKKSSGSGSGDAATAAADDDDAAGDSSGKGKKKKSKDAAATATATATASGGETPTPVPGAPDASTLVEYAASDAPFWRTDPAACVDVRRAKSGVAALEPTTVMASFAAAVEKQGDSVALRWEADDAWQQLTWREYHAQVRQAGRALLSLGLAAHESVNIIGFNSLEWFVANVAAIAAGGKAAGIYTTNGTDACKYITEHSEARVVVCENAKQLAKFLPVRAELERVVAYVVWSGELPADANEGDGGKVMTWKDFMALGEGDKHDAELDERIAAQRPGEACTLIYTSGTTGNPKAVMITHDNATWTPQAVFAVLGDDFGTAEEHAVSYLPLSHVAAQMLDIHMPIAVAATRGGNCTVHFARPDALQGTLKATLCAVSPTLFFGVPRVWEKMAEALKAVGEKTTGVKKMISSWAKNKAREAYENHQVGGSNKSPFLAGMANSLLFKVKEALGLTRCRFQMTGAAPISKETLRYFGSLNMPIFELYGMSESTGPHTLSYPGHYLLGSCGPVLPGCELAIDHVKGRDKDGEGEILFRGRHVMMGYMKNEQKTREAIDELGWLHSGDVGKVDQHGFLHITGRIKELIITAGGENVAPVPMEDAIKEAASAISNVIMVGDKRKYNVCLIALHCEPNEDQSFSSKLAGKSLTIGSSATTTEEAADCDVWKAYIEAAIGKANAAAVSRASKIQKFRILPVDLSVTGGELTSTLKNKRSVIEGKYKALIDEMYAETKK